ncbi:hypothetical protein GCM10011348_06360 [Marinobacterium nitratireducens]|uniref:Uncharacterized protein n=1 Tax=Marinobacterium nitratireducens TaxID=518897 RepID=A0A918DNP4_9GAMM|nr:hypothetical protein [Marinobacterium nitratireducens]GGO77257.1 hypothetical protein GCM10011348_06360 [Marinobacterium nitratireducens]
MIYLAILELLLFWGGLILFLVSLGLYAFRTGDYRSLLVFWQPTIRFNPFENTLNRAGLLMMILGVALRFYLFYIS